MEILNWIDKKVTDIQRTVLFGRYFDTTTMEVGIGDYDFFNRQKGIDLTIREDLTVRAIHFYSGLQQGVDQFVDELPFRLKFSLSRQETRQLLGPPGKTGGGDYYSILYGTTPPWDKYSYDSYYLHLQFLADMQSMDLITVFSLKG
jgi:hypothetical protein